MEKEFIPYELAVKLKELGFKFYPLGYYSLLEGNKIIESKFYASDDFLEAPLWQQAGNFLYICSNRKINVSINGSDTYEELCEKFEKAISNIRDLQNNKSKR